MAGTTLLQQLREKAAELPAEGPPEVVQARRRALKAMATVEAALRVDPTLAAEDRCRDLDVLDELLRQLKPLARQAQLETERRRLAGLPDTERQIARLGRTNPLALDELDALSQRAVTLADHIAGQALPDWNTPERIRERSARLLPSPERLEDIAAQLRYAVRASLQLPHPDPEAVRLAALADQITLTTQHRRERCAGPGCNRELDHAPTGRARRYCGAACRQRARRATRAGHAPPDDRASKRANDRADNAAEDALQARLAALPPDTRPAPSVAAYDDLLQHPGRPRPVLASPPGPVPPMYETGRGWDDGDLCLWREQGRWGLTGPDGEIEVPEFGLFGNSLRAGDTTGAQAAAAAAITALIGRAVTGWDRDEWARSVYGPSSWYACLAPA